MDYRELAEAVGPRTGATQEWVFRVLREGIISGKLKGGMQLKQDEVSAALTVSHIPVREALRQLEAQGLVTIHPNRGSTVTQLSRSTLEDMMEIRASISYYIARRAIPLMNEEDLSELQAVIEEQKKAQDMFIELIHCNADRYLRDALYTDPARRDQSAAEHQAILDACRAGDAEKASSLLHDHIIEARRYIPENLD